MSRKVVYTIPGWGFSANILNCGALANTPCLGLDYINYSNMSVEGIALVLSKTIKKSSVIVAWSMGGLFAIKIANLFPGKVKKLVLLASQPRFIADIRYSGIHPKVMNNFIDAANQNFFGLKQQFIDKVNLPITNNPCRGSVQPYFLDNFSEQLKSLLSLLAMTDLRDEYCHLKVEILHIIGGKDAVLKQDETSLRSINDNIKVVHIEDAGHGGFLTHVLLYRSAMDKFIEF